MKRRRFLLLALLIAVSACGGDSDDTAGGDGGNSDGGGTSSGVDDLRGDTGFGVEDLPAEFPSELIPPSFTSGRIDVLPGQETEVVAFFSEQSFDDALEHYTGMLGEGQLIEAGGSRQAQWLDGPDWAVALFVTGDDPLLITFSQKAN